jgi:hypothetical protein
LICPLFAKFGQTFSDGRLFREGLLLTVELFGMVLARNFSAQQAFAEAHGCSVITGILMTMNAINMNYSLSLFFLAFSKPVNISDCRKICLIHCYLIAYYTRKVIFPVNFQSLNIAIEL